MPRFLRDALLIVAGAMATLVVQYGMPTAGMLLYEPRFEAAYSDCETAKVNALRLKPSVVAENTYQNFRKTVVVDEFRCLDSQTLYARLRQFRVSDVAISGIEMKAKLEDKELTQ